MLVLVWWGAVMRQQQMDVVGGSAFNDQTGDSPRLQPARQLPAPKGQLPDLLAKAAAGGLLSGPRLNGALPRCSGSTRWGRRFFACVRQPGTVPPSLTAPYSETMANQ